MWKKVRFLIISVFIVGLGVCAAHASSPGTTTANFLRIGVGAKAASMGGAFTAVCDDTTALYWNPAGLAQLEGTQLSATYNSWFQDISQGYVSLAYPAFGGVCGVGANYVSLGTLEGRDESGNLTGQFSATDVKATVGYAFGSTFMLGFSAGYLQDKIGQSTNSSFLGTAGFLMRAGPNLSLGASYQNIGQELAGGSLPESIRTGACFKKGDLTLAADVVISNDEDTYFCVGTEYTLGSMFSLRGGYTTAHQEGAGYTLGAGFSTSKFDIDYAYCPYGDLGGTHRVSVSMQW